MASASSYSNLVQDLYVAYFGRPADYYGLQNFEAALAAANAPTDPAALATAYSSNAAIKSLIDSFGTSAESTNLYGSGSTESFVNAIFENLFNRPAAVTGLSFWVDAINSGQVTKGDAALAILAGAENNTSTQGHSDWLLIQNKIAVAGNFTIALGAWSTEIVAYSGTAAAQDARLMLAEVTTSTDPTTFNVQTTINDIVAGNNNNSYTLTTGVDTLSGGPGNNVFNAILDNAAGLAAGGQATTLQSFDTITGGTLNNTLNLTDFGMSSYMSIPSGATISGITTLNINSLEGIAGDTSASTALDLSGWSGLVTVNVASSNGIDFINAPTANLNIVDSSTSEYVYAAGGPTIAVTVPNTTYSEVQGTATTTTVNLTGGDDDYVYDAHNSEGYYISGLASAPTAGTNTITTVNVDAATYVDIYSDALSTLSVTDTSAAEVYSWAAAGTRALAVNLNDAVNTRVEDDTATTVNINATTKASTVLQLYFGDATAITFNDAVDLSLQNGATAGSGELEAAAAKTVTITGAGDFTADLSAVNAAAVVDASGSTGAITIEMGSATGKAGAAQSFTGGTGQDIVTVGAAQTGTVTGGAATNNEIILANAPAATEAALAAYSHFATLGVSGTTSGTFDMANLQGYNAFDVQGSGGNVSFLNVATGATLSIEGGNADIVTLQTADNTGVADSTTLTLGTTAEGGNTYLQATLQDSTFVGIGTVALVSNVSSSGSVNTLTTLGDNNWVTLNVSGTGFLDIGTSKADSASLTINNTLAASSSHSLDIATLTDNSLTSLTIKGSGGVAIDTLNSSSATLTIVDNDSAAVSIGLADTALTSATFTNSINTTSGTFAIGGTLTEAGLTTLNLNGNVQLTVAGDAVTSGITVAGGTDNATVSFTSVGATASGKTDSITLGNGDADTVVLGAGVAGSTQTVVLGSGANDSVTSTSVGSVSVTVGSSTAGTDSITADSASVFHATAGNGTNVISDTAAGASTVISVGTGANSITVGGDMTGTSVSGTISFGTHASTVVDSVTLGESGSATTTVTGLEKISGLNNNGADTLTFASDAGTVASMQQITPSEVAAAGGDTTLLASWIAAATGAAGSGVTTAAHSISWFTYQSNTYLVEMVGADSGTLAATDTVVELTGTGYTFAKTTFAAGGVVHLLG